MSKEDKGLSSQSTDAFEFIGRMAQKRKEKSEKEEREHLEESKIQNSSSCKLQQ